MSRDPFRTLYRELSDLGHATGLAEKMAPDPREWDFTGDITDAGPIGGLHSRPASCACGHAVRYQYWIERARDGKRLAIGSTCIGTTVPMLIASGAEKLAGKLEAALAAVQAAQAEQERRARDAANDERVAAVVAEIDRLRVWRADVRRRDRWPGGRIPDALYWLRGIPDVKPLSTPGRTLASARKRLAAAREACSSAAAAVGLSLPGGAS